MSVQPDVRERKFQTETYEHNWREGVGQRTEDRDKQQQKDTETERNTPQEIDRAQQKASCGCQGSWKIEHPSLFMRISS